jgi:hypothetical protein
MTNPAVTGTPAPVSYSLPKTNAKVLALLESHLTRMNSFAVLTGRTVIIEMERR